MCNAMERKDEAAYSGCGEELFEFDKISSDERISKLSQLLFDRIKGTRRHC